MRRIPSERGISDAYSCDESEFYDHLDTVFWQGSHACVSVCAERVGILYHELQSGLEVGREGLSCGAGYILYW